MKEKSNYIFYNNEHLFIKSFMKPIGLCFLDIIMKPSGLCFLDIMVHISYWYSKVFTID